MIIINNYYSIIIIINNNNALSSPRRAQAGRKQPDLHLRECKQAVKRSVVGVTVYNKNGRIHTSINIK